MSSITSWAKPRPFMIAVSTSFRPLLSLSPSGLRRRSRMNRLFDCINEDLFPNPRIVSNQPLNEPSVPSENKGLGQKGAFTCGVETPKHILRSKADGVVHTKFAGKLPDSLTVPRRILN